MTDVDSRMRVAPAVGDFPACLPPTLEMEIRRMYKELGNIKPHIVVSHIPLWTLGYDVKEKIHATSDHIVISGPLPGSMSG